MQVTGTNRSSADLDLRRRKALFRSWHRGIREMDLILGAFADATIASLTASELEQYEALLDAPDGDLLDWITGQARVPQEFDSTVFRKLLAGRQVAPISQP